MDSFKRITTFENTRRIGLLDTFINAWNRYVAGTVFGAPSGTPDESDDARLARVELNQIVNEVHDIVWSAEIDSRLVAIIDGKTKLWTTDLILDIFSLHEKEGNLMLRVNDILIRARAKYHRNSGASIIRTYNPVFWIGRLISWLASLPITFIEWLGLPRVRIEGNVIGRWLLKIVPTLVKAIGSIVVFAGTLVGLIAALKELGWLEPIKTALRFPAGNG